MASERVCLFCGAVFLIVPAREKTARFCSLRCAGLAHSGENHHRWNGGRSIDVAGYARVIAPPGHPRADCNGRVYEHILVVEKALGKFLPRAARVHHVNEQKADNRGANLVACESDAYHFLIHARTRILRSGFSPRTHKICSRCKATLPREQFGIKQSEYDGLADSCKPCRSAYGAESYLRRKRKAA